MDAKPPFAAEPLRAEPLLPRPLQRTGPPPRTEPTPRTDAPMTGRMTGRSPLRPAFALAEHLDALAGGLYGMSDANYLAHPADGVTGAIALHVRRAVDHVLALLDRPSGQVMTYDGSGLERGPGREYGAECGVERDRQHAPDLAVEHDRRQAIAVLRGLAVRVRDMAPRTADVPIVVDAPLDRLGARIRLHSSLGRELVFVLQQVSVAERVTGARCAS